MDKENDRSSWGLAEQSLYDTAWRLPTPNTSSSSESEETENESGDCEASTNSSNNSSIVFLGTRKRRRTPVIYESDSSESFNSQILYSTTQLISTRPPTELEANMRRSKRQAAAKHVTPPPNGTRRKQAPPPKKSPKATTKKKSPNATTKKKSSSTRKQAGKKTSASSSSVATSSSSAAASKKKAPIRNPYSRKKKAPPPAAAAPLPSPPSSPMNDLIAAPVLGSPLNLDDLPSPNHLYDIDEEENTASNFGFETAVPSIPDLVSTGTDNNDINSFQVEQAEGFTIAGILKNLGEVSFQAGTSTEIKMRDLTNNTAHYENQKQNAEDYFLHCLAQHPRGKALAELIQDPSNPASKIPRLYVLCRGPPAPNKKALLNWALLQWAMRYIKVEYRKLDLSNDPILFANAQYQPNVVTVQLRMLFSAFRRHHIMYSNKNDFGGPGEVHSYWKHIFQVAEEHRMDYGRLPNKSTFDEKWFEKRAKAAADENNEFDPDNNLEHFVMAAIENVQYQFCLRGQKEPASICVQDFEIKDIEKGSFAGIPSIRLIETFRGQKNNALTISKPVKDAENTKKKTFPCPYNKHPLSVYQTLTKLIKMIPDEKYCSDKGGVRLFRKPASLKELEFYESIGHPEWKFTSNHNRCIGKNTINSKLVALAKMCGYTDADRCTSHGRRRLGISAVANSSEQVAPTSLVQLGGHSSLNLVATYGKTNQDADDKVIRAKAGSPTAIRQQLALLEGENDENAVDLDRKMPAIDHRPRRVSDQYQPAASSNEHTSSLARESSSYRRGRSPPRSYREDRPYSSPSPRRNRPESPRNRRYSSRDRYSPRNRRYSSRDRYSPRNRRYSSPTDRRYSPRDRRYSSRDRYSPRDRRYSSPRDRRYSPRDRRYSSPRDRRYSPRDRRYSSPRDRRYSRQDRRYHSPDRRNSFDRGSNYHQERRISNSYHQSDNHGRAQHHHATVVHSIDRYQTQQHQQVSYQPVTVQPNYQPQQQYVLQSVPAQQGFVQPTNLFPSDRNGVYYR